jgi:transposase-like protein
VSENARKRPTYSAEFKAEAVAKCAKVGINQTFKDLGISIGSLRNWVIRSGPQLTADKPSYEELEKQVQKLKRELGYVSEINEILKKSTAIFSAGTLGGSR